MPTIGIPATCYRTEKAQIPKSAGESAGKSAGEKRTAGGTAGSSADSLLFQKSRPPSTAPSSPPSSPLFPGTLPSTLPGTFGDLGFLRPVAGRWDSKPTTPFGGPFWVSRCQEIEGDMMNQGENKTKKQKKTKCQDMKSTHLLGGCLCGHALLLTVGAFLLTVKLLCLQSLKALTGRTFPL